MKKLGSKKPQKPIFPGPRYQPSGALPLAHMRLLPKGPCAGDAKVACSLPTRLCPCGVRLGAPFRKVGPTCWEGTSP